MSSVVVSSRPSYRPYCAEVRAVRRLSPSFVRVTFGCDDFADFGTAGLDQRVKLLLPLADGSISDVGQRDEEAIATGAWYERWRNVPTEERSPLRTYTVRRVAPEAREIDVDFVVHHDAGPAGEWAANAHVGQELVVVGPDERSEHSRLGLDFHPGTARRLLLAGDETAVPAISAILESLPAGIEVDAFLEVPTTGDALTLDAPATHRVTWIPREDAAHGARLIAALEGWCAASGDVLARAAAPRPQVVDDVDVDRDLIWDSPEDAEGDFYAWFAGEAATIKTLRRMLVSTGGVDRKRVAFMGYWRLGQAERQA
ncbi:siderophore-interacting protein [Microbacterium hatanonis]|uniref:Siderophore-interacting protein n=1 Tax=Microbacterium hatanonis TaxID=404366 RepID=A0A5C8I3X0_9MICO|nr:siderophore-interacting protein [Microbacterium hatanonis]TXK12911.1 siderophore-interacting protein [Microbacterium hatanonis]